MQHWDLTSHDVQPHHPEVLDSTGEGRTIFLVLPAGESLGEHQVHERAWVLVVSGAVQISAGDQHIEGGPGLLAAFEPHERREVRAQSETRVLLVLAPWPGEGRPPQWRS